MSYATRINVSLLPAELEAIDRYAAQHSLSRSAAVGALCRIALGLKPIPHEHTRLSARKPQPPTPSDGYRPGENQHQGVDDLV